MKLFTRAFADWCHIHQIPLDKVVLVVRAHDELTRHRIEQQVFEDFKADMFVDTQEVASAHRLTLNGVRVSFSTLDRSRQ